MEVLEPNIEPVSTLVKSMNMLIESDAQNVGEIGRGECSLCVLTNQFLKYMAANGENTVDLKQAAIDLQVCDVFFRSSSCA
jgi:hypothetical protein